MTERTRLPGLAAAGDIRANVKRVAESGQCKRLKDEAADCFDIEIFIKVFAVDFNFAGTLADANSCARGFSASGGADFRFGHCCVHSKISIKVLPVQDSEPHADALLRHILSV